MLELIKPTSVVSVFLQILNKQDVVFFFFFFFSVIFQGDHGPERACKKLAKESVQSWDQSLLMDARKKV